MLKDYLIIFATVLHLLTKYNCYLLAKELNIIYFCLGVKIRFKMIKCILLFLFCFVVVVVVVVFVLFVNIMFFCFCFYF